MNRRGFLYASGLTGTILLSDSQFFSKNFLNPWKFQDDKKDYFPFLFVPLSANDNGLSRNGSHELGPDSSAIWFEKFEVSGRKNPPIYKLSLNAEYQIAVTVKNGGNAPSYCLCIDFLQWRRNIILNGERIREYEFIGITNTTLQETVLMDGESNTFRSTKWVPRSSPDHNFGDIIVRVYDPTSDNLTEYEDHSLRPQADRHLGHHSYQI